MERYFSFEIVILDKKKARREFKCSNFQTVMRMKPNSCSMPIKLDPDWNEIKLDLR